MNVTVTGGLGAAGSYLVEHLKKHGDRVSIINRPNCNLLDFDEVCDHLDCFKPEVIYHLASDADVRESFDIPYTVMHNNMIGTVNLFEACRKVNQRPVVQVCSTSEVYGSPTVSPISEDFALEPINPYSVSKTAQDLMGGMYAKAYGFKVVRTRAFGYVNPRRENLSLSSFSRQIVEIEKGRSKELRHGNLRSVRTFCDVRDISKAYRLAALKEGIYNIGSERPITIGECLEILCGFARVRIKCVQDEKLYRPTDVVSQVPNCSKFKSATGWEPEIKLEDSLKWLLETCRAYA